jgi:uncharacterized protein (TIGR02453 family)
MGGFSGFDPGACAWFAVLAANNTRDWFEANRALHRRGIADPMHALLVEAQAEHGGEVKLFRPNRDVRFSADKSPYHTHQRAALHGLGPMALWAAIDAEGFMAGGGVYGFSPDRLSRYRDVVAGESGAAFGQAVAEARAAGLEFWGESLARVPRGYPADHPRAELLRMKSLALSARIGPEATTDPHAVRAHARRCWDAVRPVADWLLAAMGRRD